MKKTLIIMLLCLISFSTVFCVGCTDDEKRKIGNFYSEYLSIAESSQNMTTTIIPQQFNSSTNKKCIGFVYSDTLVSAMTSSPYKELDTLYNTLLNDIMGPTYLYSDTLTKTKISKKEKKQLFSKLDALKDGYLNVSQRLGDLERVLTESGTNENISLTALSNLYLSYEQLLDGATKLSKQIYSIYFNRVMENANPDYISKSDDQIDLQDLALIALNKKIYFLSVYADIYLHLEIVGRSAPDRIIAGNFDLIYQPYKTLSEKSYTKTFKSDIEANRAKIIENARALQLIQNDFEKKYTEYQKSISKIIYCKVDLSSSANENGHKNIVDKFTSPTGIVYNSCQVLTNILDLCFEQG